MKQAIIFTVILCFCFFSAYAQIETPFRVETDLVSVSVLVRDAKGNFVEGLRKEQFEIYDDGKKQEIEHFSAADAPVSYGIVYDTHPTTSERTVAVLESLREFTKNLKTSDDFFTIVFNLRGSLITDFVPTAEQVEGQLGDRYRQPYALYDAIFLANEKLKKSRNLKRVLLVITDSADHYSEHNFTDVLRQLKTLDAQIYAVLWDKADEWRFADITHGEYGNLPGKVSSDASSLDRAALQELALRSGGSMRSPTVQNAQELFRIYSEIAVEIKRQYTLGFYPEKPNGKWHDLRVILPEIKNRKRTTLSYRLGYQSPPPKSQ